MKRILSCFILLFVAGIASANDPLPPPIVKDDPLPPPIASHSDPYKIRNEAEFKQLLEWDTQPALIVGKVTNPFIGSYRGHYSVPSGWRNLADGVYLASGRWDAIVVIPHKAIEKPNTAQPSSLKRMTAIDGTVVELRDGVWWVVSSSKTVAREVVTSRPFVQLGADTSALGPPITAAPIVEPTNRGFRPVDPTSAVIPIGVRTVGRGASTNCPT